jgi:ribosomal protein S14
MCALQAWVVGSIPSASTIFKLCKTDGFSIFTQYKRAERGEKYFARKYLNYFIKYVPPRILRCRQQFLFRGALGFIQAKWVEQLPLCSDASNKRQICVFTRRNRGFQRVCGFSRLRARDLSKYGLLAGIVKSS